MNTSLAVTGQQQTMLSTEIVKIINELRDEGAAELRHRDFMMKAAKVLGEEGVRKFSDTYIHPQNGQKYPCLRLPKREAHLMVMSESYKVQATVYDRMVELEQQQLQLADDNLKVMFADVIEKMAVIQKIIKEQDETLKRRALLITNVPSASKRNTIPELSRCLNVSENAIVRTLVLEGYLDDDNVPTKNAFTFFDFVNGEISWSLALVMKILKKYGCIPN